MEDTFERPPAAQIEEQDHTNQSPKTPLPGASSLVLQGASDISTASTAPKQHLPGPDKEEESNVLAFAAKVEHAEPVISGQLDRFVSRADQLVTPENTQQEVQVSPKGDNTEELRLEIPQSRCPGKPDGKTREVVKCRGGSKINAK